MSCHNNNCRMNNKNNRAAQPRQTNGAMCDTPPTTIQDPYYTAGFLKKHIGENMRVEFSLGANGPLIDRVGLLTKVDASYIVLTPYLSNDQLMCDLYSIKFVTIYR